MTSVLPTYASPDFTYAPLADAPLVRTAPAPEDGVAPEHYHATSIHPEYLHIRPREWYLVRESRMDCVVVLRDNAAEVVEARRLREGDAVVLGREESGEEGIFVHTTGFTGEVAERGDKFAFRTRGSRETPFSRSYDRLYEILRHDRESGYIVWVLGPAVAFDKDSRDAMQALIERGFCHALLAGNALATHDLEAAWLRTGLGQDIYSQELAPLGHYHHLDVLNRVRHAGSIHAALNRYRAQDGIIYACEECNVPYVLAGSIRDDGPLPETIADAYEAQDAMRVHARQATTVITLATQLHSIAFGNMTPSYRVMEDDSVRPVFFYIVDMSEFSSDKLANRGSNQAAAILTNAQDFIINLWHNLAEN